MVSLSDCYSSLFDGLNAEVQIRWLQMVVRNTFYPDLPRVRAFLHKHVSTTTDTTTYCCWYYSLYYYYCIEQVTLTTRTHVQTVLSVQNPGITSELITTYRTKNKSEVFFLQLVQIKPLIVSGQVPRCWQRFFTRIKIRPTVQLYCTVLFLLCTIIIFINVYLYVFSISGLYCTFLCWWYCLVCFWCHWKPVLLQITGCF